ncbi:hypothetical protein SDC9_209160 [bioreactor metagenome]|uniref:Uncharacterized protein n=1 Tax=bioreactor metagenome TaxID=1076179 RepID=A0A645JPB2_9ZZZZ
MRDTSPAIICAELGEQSGGMAESGEADRNIGRASSERFDGCAVGGGQDVDDCFADDGHTCRHRHTTSTGQLAADVHPLSMRYGCRFRKPTADRTMGRAYAPSVRHSDGSWQRVS